MIITRRITLLGVAALAACTHAPDNSQPAPALHIRLQPLARFTGRWTGTGSGEPGDSTVERTYTPILAGRFIEVRHRSIYPPQKKNPKGEIHDDVGYFSHDNGRKRFVLRQFHVEGFFNQYVAATEGFDGEKLVFTSEALENIPPGMKARETYTFTGANAFEELFEIAENGTDYQVYSHNHFTRA